MMVRIINGCQKIGLPGQVIIATLLAVSLGLVFQKAGATDDDFVGWLSFPGTLWKSSLMMMIVPLVFSNILTAVIDIKDMSGSGRLGLAMVGLYALTTIFAATVGLVLSSIVMIPNVDPVDPSEIPQHILESSKVNTEVEGRDMSRQIQALLKSFFPTNVIAAAADFDLIGVIAFALFLALALPKNSVFVSVVSELSEAVYKILGIIIVLTPLGTFCILIEQIIIHDIADILHYVSIFVTTSFAALFLMDLVTYPVLYVCFTRKNPYVYMRNILPAMFTALGTDSSAATLPMTIQCAVERNGIPANLAKCVLSVGATMNMDGAAIYFTVQALFLAATQGISIPVGRMISLAAVASIQAMGAAPIPNAGLVYTMTVTKAIGVPVGPLYGLLLVVGPYTGRLGTMTNITGDSFVCGILSHFFGDEVLKEAQNKDATPGKIPGSFACSSKEIRAVANSNAMTIDPAKQALEAASDKSPSALAEAKEIADAV